MKYLNHSLVRVISTPHIISLVYACVKWIRFFFTLMVLLYQIDSYRVLLAFWFIDWHWRISILCYKYRMKKKRWNHSILLALPRCIVTHGQSHTPRQKQELDLRYCAYRVCWSILINYCIYVYLDISRVVQLTALFRIPALHRRRI